METEKTLHSKEYFGPERQYWWHTDFLELMGRRWGLDGVTSVLDVGCGLGLWTASLSYLLPDSVQMVGIDAEPEWIRIANSVAQEFGLDHRRQFEIGHAEHLDYPDHSFDLVTCQTLLIHLKDADLALREMIRVLRPGGLLILVEPNNVIQTLCSCSTRTDELVEDTLARVRFHVLCERGRRLLGEGHFSIGDLLPGMLDELGIEGIQVYQSDHAHALWGDYESDEQAAFVKFAGAEGDSRTAACAPWPPEDARRYFLAAGGTEDEFEDSVRRLEAEDRRTRKAVLDGTYNRAGGKIMYLISGRKPID